MQHGAATGRTATLPPDLDRHKYLSLTTYRRDGRAVSTPVWFVVDEGTICVSTGEATGKVRRLRRDPRVTLAPSDPRGRLRGASFEAVASFAPAAACWCTAGTCGSAGRSPRRRSSGRWTGLRAAMREHNRPRGLIISPAIA